MAESAPAHFTVMLTGQLECAEVGVRFLSIPIGPQHTHADRCVAAGRLVHVPRARAPSTPTHQNNTKTNHNQTNKH